MKRWCLVLVLFLGLLSTAEARPTRALLNVSINWTIVADGVLNNATIDVSIPSNSSNQKILYQEISDNFSVVPGSEGSRVKFEFDGARSKLIRGSFLIQTDYLNRSETETDVASAMKEKYLENTTTVIITPEITAVAEEFGSKTFPMDLVGMMNWTFRNVKYNLSYTDVTVNDVVGVTLSSEWVFLNRVGVCDELSTLFTAMARSQGYATRLITGFAFTDGKWIPHAWTEVFVPKYGWIEIDPTHNQFMNLNAKRVRIGQGSDMSEMADRINATSYDATSVSLQVNTDIQIINSSEDDAVSVDAVFLPQPQLQQTQPVIVKTKNRASGPVFTNAMFVPPMTVDCDNCVDQVFLEPNETKSLEATLTLPQLAPNVKYTFPSSVVTDYGRTNVSFERVQVEQSIAEKYMSIEDLPDSFKWFLGLFMIGAIALVIAAIILKW